MRSWPWTSQPAPIRRLARSRCSAELKELERVAGRRGRGRWGPRELDLDLLVFGRHRIVVERPPRRARSRPQPTRPRPPGRLEVPHRDAGERLFVLAPLADLAPRLTPPGWGETVETRRRRVAAREAANSVRRIARWHADARSVGPRAGLGLTAYDRVSGTRMRDGAAHEEDP